MDEAELPSEFHRQELMLRRLFVEGAIFTFPGLTKVMLETLRKPRTFIVQGRLKTIGSCHGPSGDVRDACLRRMQAFARLAAQVLEAEFPNFSLLSSFRVFALSDRSRRAILNNSSDTDQETCLRRLAQVFAIMPEDLINQFRHFEPYAEQVYAQRSCSNLDAWAKVVTSLRRRRSDALLSVLTRYAAWISSSCGVERTFAKTSGLRRGLRQEGGRLTPRLGGQLPVREAWVWKIWPLQCSELCPITCRLGCGQLGLWSVRIRALLKTSDEGRGAWAIIERNASLSVSLSLHSSRPLASLM